MLKKGILKTAASAVAVAAGCGFATSASANDDVLANIEAGNVVMPGIDYNQWNMTSFEQITPENVGELQMTWTLNTGLMDEFQAPPVVVGDVMYIVAPVATVQGDNSASNWVIALDLTTEGTVLWEFRPDVDREASLQACCGDQTRGIQYAEGKLFYQTLDGQVFALDAETGEALWRSIGADITIREHTPGNGVIVDDLYIIGNAGGEYGVRGKVSAFDINTGQTQWVMYSMGPNNEVGIGPRFDPVYAYMQMENPALSTWFGDSWRRGGGTVWAYIPVNLEENLFYYGTGNCGPWNPDYRREWGVVNLDENGELMDYFNNFCASTMARDTTSGELIWAFNQVPADPWDLDMTTPHQLIDYEGTNALINISRNGYVMVWDSATGELLRQPFMHTFVDVIMGWNMDTGLPVYNYGNWPFTDPADRDRYTDFEPEAGVGRDDYTGTEIDYCPGTSVRNWPSDAWNPDLGLMYTPNNTDCRSMVVFEGEYVAGEGYTLQRRSGPVPARWFGEDFPRGGTEYTWEQLTFNDNRAPAYAETIAVDPVAGEVVWTVGHDSLNRASIMSTSTGLVFQGSRADGAFHAYDGATGEELWKFRTGSGYSGSPISYIGPDGRQYIAVIGSNRSNLNVNPGDAPNDQARFNRGGATLYVFALPTSVAGN
jgi:PQQ-dependent dehydrogenase (methanol/ethanol family)